jgi:predicted transcriptional regulator
MNTHQNKTQKQAVTVVVTPEIHEGLADAAYQLRETQTKIASAAIVHYLDHLKRTKKIIHHKPSTQNVGGFAICR